MDLAPHAEETAFLSELRDWLADIRPPNDLRDFGNVPTIEDIDAGRAWQQMLHEGGWAGVAWPSEHGGRGASLLQHALFLEEMARAGLPAQVSLVGVGLAGPIIIAAGTPQQQQRYLQPMLRGDHIWCQMFSEPEAGSDLAGLQTQAVPDGDGWRIRGQKIWTSGAHYSDFGLLLARSDPEASRHRGISCFVLPMDRPGIEVRPLRQMDDVSKFNEVFLDDVPVQADELLGDLHNGWSLALSVLARERLMLGASSVKLSAVLERLWDEAGKRGIMKEPLFRDRWISLWIRARLVRLTWLRLLSTLEQSSDAAQHLPRMSSLKLMGSELQRDVAALSTRVVGPEINVGTTAEHWRDGLLAAPGATIMGGTSEIQRNVLAERVLGLPRSPA